jgi:hypothetical protein
LTDWHPELASRIVPEPDLDKGPTKRPSGYHLSARLRATEPLPTNSEEQQSLAADTSVQLYSQQKIALPDK